MLQPLWFRFIRLGGAMAVFSMVFERQGEGSKDLSTNSRHKLSMLT
jgi:hypothetical protein